jgi:hypothetical protein
MAFKNRIQETTQTTGTGTLTLNGATAGYRRFNQVDNNTTLRYLLEEDGTGRWEIGIGTYNNNTLARTTLVESSTGGRLNLAAVNPSGSTGIHRISHVLTAEDLVQLQGDVGQQIQELQDEITALKASLYAYDY